LLTADRLEGSRTPRRQWHTFDRGKQPGWIETDMTASMQSNPLVKKMQSSVTKNTVLLRRSGKAEDGALRCDGCGEGVPNTPPSHFR
jgi:hypothetical protein